MPGKLFHANLCTPQPAVLDGGAQAAAEIEESERGMTLAQKMLRKMGWKEGAGCAQLAASQSQGLKLLQAERCPTCKQASRENARHPQADLMPWVPALLL